jgi:hypothetical protein
MAGPGKPGRRTGQRAPTKCQVCSHAERVRIDYLLCSGGASLRALGSKFGVSYSSLFNHGRRHISDEYRASVRLGPLQDVESLRALAAKIADSTLEALRSVNAGVASRWLAALEAGADDTFIGLTARLHKGLELQARLTRELLPAQPATVIINNITLYQLPEFVHAISAICLALKPYPEARQAVAAALRRLDCEVSPIIEAQPNSEAA